MPIDLRAKRVVVTGGAGFLGSAVCRTLRERGCVGILAPRSADYDLTREAAAQQMYHDMRPDVVIHLAAEVGGIGANIASPGRYFYANLAMALHLIEGARANEIDKFVQVGTVCSYPKHCPVPIREEDLWTGYPEGTNAPYGIAKKAALVMLDAYRRQYGLRSACLLPANLYGPGDNFDPRTSHVIPALIRKCMEATENGASSITCWGTGQASREFLFVDDAAEGIVRAAERVDDPTPINIGTGREITIAALVSFIAQLTGFTGAIEWDASNPDGQPRRWLDVTRARELLDFESRVDLKDGLRRTIEWWRRSQVRAREETSDQHLVPGA